MIPTIIAIFLFAVGYGIFRRFNMGLARNSRGQQLRRSPHRSRTGCHSDAAHAPKLILPAGCLRTADCHAVDCHLQRLVRQNQPADVARLRQPHGHRFGIYIFGWLSALQGITAALSPAAAGIVTGLAEAAILIIPLAHIGYYSVYRTCIDDAGMIPMLDTYASETVEYVRSLAL